MFCSVGFGFANVELVCVQHPILHGRFPIDHGGFATNEPSIAGEIVEKFLRFQLREIIFLEMFLISSMLVCILYFVFFIIGKSYMHLEMRGWLSQVYIVFNVCFVYIVYRRYQCLFSTCFTTSFSACSEPVHFFCC